MVVLNCLSRTEEQEARTAAQTLKAVFQFSREESHRLAAL